MMDRGGSKWLNYVPLIISAWLGNPPTKQQ